MAIVNRQEIKFGRQFGHADTHPGDGSRLSDMTAEVRTEAMAHFHACPVRERVVAMFGNDWTFKRYLECNHIHKHELLDEALKTNFDLYKQLISPIKRLEGELPDQTINPANIPPSYDTEMSPLSAPTGYAPSRIILVWAGIKAGVKDSSGTNSKERVAVIKNKLKELVSRAKDPIELTLAIAEEAIKMDADSEQIIGHLMSLDILKEQGCKTMYKEILTRMETEAPVTYKKYLEMCTDTKRMNSEGIITPDDLK